MASPTLAGRETPGSTALIDLSSASPCVGASGQCCEARDQFEELSRRNMMLGASERPPEVPVKTSMSSANAAGTPSATLQTSQVSRHREVIILPSNAVARARGLRSALTDRT